MERPGVAQVTSQEEREIRGAFRDLYVTWQGILEPPTIQLRRRDQYSGEFVNVYQPFQPMQIEMADRMEQATGANAGMVEQTNDGTMTVPDTLGVQRDDRFTLDGEPCVVTFVDPEVDEIGYREVAFRLLGGR